MGVIVTYRNNNSQHSQQSQHQSLYTYPQHQLPSEHEEGDQLDTTGILPKILSAASSSRSAGSGSGSGSQQTLEDEYLHQQQQNYWAAKDKQDLERRRINEVMSISLPLSTTAEQSAGGPPVMSYQNNNGASGGYSIAANTSVGCTPTHSTQSSISLMFSNNPSNDVPCYTIK